MKILLSRVTVADSQSPYNGKVCDVWIQNGIITSIKSTPIVTDNQTLKIPAKGCMLMPGLVDMRAHAGEPGFEQKETLLSTSMAAAAGGYTRVAVLPNTMPAMQTKQDMQFIVNASESLPVTLLPIGALTKDRKGTEWNELYDMHLHGAVAFSDGNAPVMNAGILQRALEYTSLFNGLIYIHAHDANLATQSGISEGKMATFTGMKGIPHIAEELMVARDIELLRYAGGRMHFSHISSKGSVELIRKAKKSGLHVTCDVAVSHLVWTEDALEEYDTHFKLSPPLRTTQDKKALWDGLLDDTIDAIVSDHYPQDIESKALEFEYAAHGMIQLQTAFSLVLTYAPKGYTLDHAIKHMSRNPRTILNQPDAKITVGSTAELTLCEPEQYWTFQSGNNLSKSANSPLIGTPLKGIVRGIINKNKFVSTHD